VITASISVQCQNMFGASILVSMGQLQRVAGETDAQVKQSRGTQGEDNHVEDHCPHLRLP
jgi:hypothetical protein